MQGPRAGLVCTLSLKLYAFCSIQDVQLPPQKLLTLSRKLHLKYLVTASTPITFSSKMAHRPFCMKNLAVISFFKGTLTFFPSLLATSKFRIKKIWGHLPHSCLHLHSLTQQKEKAPNELQAGLRNYHRICSPFYPS